MGGMKNKDRPETEHIEKRSDDTHIRDAGLNGKDVYDGYED